MTTARLLTWPSASATSTFLPFTSTTCAIKQAFMQPASSRGLQVSYEARGPITFLLPLAFTSSKVHTCSKQYAWSYSYDSNDSNNTGLLDRHLYKHRATSTCICYANDVL